MKKTFRFVIFLFPLLLHPLPLSAKEGSFLPADFSKARPFLCGADRLETLKSIGQTCSLRSFTVRGADLNNDGKKEWIFFGPSGECGAHGNCPFMVLKEEGGKWHPLPKQECSSEDCLGWANSLGTEVLPTLHKGFHDLLIASDSGSFFWTKSVYEWDGAQYKIQPGSTTYYLVDGEGKLKQVPRSRWENCSKNGKECLD